jgi:hypothetical protein
MRRTKYDAEKLAPLVASSHSLSEVIRKLGLKPTGGNHRHISARVRLAELDTSHFGRTLRLRVEEVPVEDLRQLVASASSLAQVLTALGLPPMGRAHHELEKRITELRIDRDHLTGQGWARGKTKKTSPSLARGVARRSKAPEEIFVESAPVMKSSRIVSLLLEMGWSYRCAHCGIADWCGRPLVLHLDHVNGINNDNRLTNLRLLCPNCHSQTPTYCRRPPKPSRASEPSGSYACYTTPTRAWRNWLTHHI